MRKRASTAPFEAVVIGASAGGVELLSQLIPALSARFPAPVIVCLHAGEGMTSGLAKLLAGKSALPVLEAEAHQRPLAGRVYLAPGGYHLLVERDLTFGLSLDPPVRHARPSIDVLFESAAAAWNNHLVGIVLSGASTDGVAGARAIQDRGGYLIVQKPETAKSAVMPEAVLKALQADSRVSPEELPDLLRRLFAPPPRS